MHLNLKFSVVLVATLAICSTPALAYMGPGIGLGAISTSLGILGAILLGLVSILWYPLKRLFRRIRKEKPKKP
jgi:uncharacterized membrane protein YadS